MEPKKVFFLQGGPADSIFYLRTGRAKLTVVSPYGQGSHEVIEMEDPRCKIAAIEAEDPRCKNLLSGVEIEMEDPRCKSLLIRVVIGMEDPRCGIEAVKTEDPRCKNLHMLAGDELVRPTEKDFSGEVPAHFTAEGTLNGDGLERKFLPTGEHVAAAPFAGDDERFSA